MSPDQSSTERQPPSTEKKADTLSVSEMLTPLELAQLKQAASENSTHLQKGYPSLKIIE